MVPVCQGCCEERGIIESQVLFMSTYLCQTTCIILSL